MPLLTTGELYVQRTAFKANQVTRPSQITILLYNQSTDQVTDSGNLSSIATEPTGSQYSRQTVSLDSSDITIADNGDIEAQLKDLTFTVADSTQTVDAYGVIASYDATLLSQGNNGDNLIAYSQLQSTIDLSTKSGDLVLPDITFVLS